MREGNTQCNIKKTELSGLPSTVPIDQKKMVITRAIESHLMIQAFAHTQDGESLLLGFGGTNMDASPTLLVGKRVEADAEIYSEALAELPETISREGGAII